MGLGEDHEGAGYLPFEFLGDFLTLISSEGKVFQGLHYGDLNWCGNYSLDEMYALEWQAWLENGRKTLGDKVGTLLQFDIDSEPERGMEVVRLLEKSGIRASVMVFNNRINRRELRESGKVRFTDYDLDFGLLNSLATKGHISVGYHTNAMEQALWNPEASLEIFQKDVEELRAKFGSIEIFSPHGGIAGPSKTNNHDIPMTSHLQEEMKIRWVHNRRAPRFNSAFSDGGFSNPNRPEARLDFVKFASALLPRQRARVLIHPQYFTFPHGDVNIEKVPIHVLRESWYQEILGFYRPDQLRWAKLNRLETSSVGGQFASSPWLGFPRNRNALASVVAPLGARIVKWISRAATRW